MPIPLSLTARERFDVLAHGPDSNLEVAHVSLRLGYHARLVEHPEH